MLQFQETGIPYKWYTEICKNTGYADNNAITLLSYFVFVCPIWNVDDKGMEKIVISHRQILEALNMAKTTQIAAMKRLEEIGVIQMQIVHEVEGFSVGNALTVLLDPRRLVEISYPDEENSPVGCEQVQQSAWEADQLIRRMMTSSEPEFAQDQREMTDGSFPDIGGDPYG